MQFIYKVFDYLHARWESGSSPKVMSTILIAAFLLSLIAVGIQEIFDIRFLKDGINFFLAIDTAFSVLLIFEILGLIFILPKSVADSVGKQFEILSIILLRSAFKEFGYFFQGNMDGEPISYTELRPMLSAAFGAFVIFFVIGLYYKKQMHERTTTDDNDRSKFIMAV